MSKELKPCPFCGGDARSQRNGDVANPYSEVVCDACDFCGPAEGTDEKAAAAWNRRARPSPMGEKVEAERIIRHMQGIADASRRADGSDIPLGEQCREAATTIAALVAERDEARANTSNLLARIHRDGGHYESEHGTAKAVADADLIVSDMLVSHDATRKFGETINEILDAASTRIAVDEWFSRAQDKTAYEVEGFARRIRAILLDAAVALATPYRDAATAAESALATANARVAEMEKALKEIATKDQRPYIQIGDDPNECGPTIMVYGQFAKIARAALTGGEDAASK